MKSDIESLPLIKLNSSSDASYKRPRTCRRVRSTITALVSLTWDRVLSCIAETRDIAMGMGLVAGHPPSHFSSWFTQGINHVPCHSHNDYWHRVPLLSALMAGCSSVEADVWLDGPDLRVGHTSSTLLEGHTFRSLYLDPLLQILEKNNPLPSTSNASPSAPGSASVQGRRTRRRREDELVGLFGNDPAQTLTILVDFKDDPERIWDALMQDLKPLREAGFLSFFNGSERIVRPVTIVATGEAPFHRILENENHRDIFYDAPLDKVTYFSEFGAGVEGSDFAQGGSDEFVYNSENSYYASVDFRRAIGPLPLNRMTQDQLARLQSQVSAAHARGLKVRYWGTPSRPIGLRNYVWRALVREGVDVLSVDDVYAVTMEDWSSPGWLRST
ncbi:hypothetical protein N7466_006283 [Penicillium verhagenii]|uniref:uncharacterized protein n=1 Tax=Penicillium verhagenii TaxID=1562060 RepID=UPI0025459709|nr:uncharacterized protein N7466_006283 [Penicillium verhagenii]KAJ5930790.1 hypothetical protein N7466_006283 [Penicillium verhagenii]